MKKFVFVAVALVSLAANAQRVELGRATKSLKIKAGGDHAALSFNIPVYRFDQQVVVETVACKIPQCSNEMGDGSEGNWHNFFGAKVSEKPEALAAAIKGIGPVTAEKIVDNNLFTFKPNSWKEFSALIKKIEKQLEVRGYNYKFSTQVLEVYGYENLISLGYGNERSCKYVESTCRQYSVQEVKSISHYIPRNLTVDVKNQVLQSFESDIVEITVGTAANDIAISSSGYNDYAGTIYNNGSVLELEGKRIFRAMPTTDTAAALVKDVNNNFSWTLAIPSKFTAEDVGAKIEVTYEVCKQTFLGGCSVVGGPWKSEVLNNRITKTFTTGGLKKGSKFFIRARLNKVDSQFYSNAKSDYVYSNTIRN